MVILWKLREELVSRRSRFIFHICLIKIGGCKPSRIFCRLARDHHRTASNIDLEGPGPVNDGLDGHRVHPGLPEQRNDRYTYVETQRAPTGMQILSSGFPAAAHDSIMREFAILVVAFRASSKRKVFRKAGGGSRTRRGTPGTRTCAGC